MYYYTTTNYMSQICFINIFWKGMPLITDMRQLKIQKSKPKQIKQNCCILQLRKVISVPAILSYLLCPILSEKCCLPQHLFFSIFRKWLQQLEQQTQSSPKWLTMLRLVQQLTNLAHPLLSNLIQVFCNFF